MSGRRRGATTAATACRTSKRVKAQAQAATDAAAQLSVPSPDEGTPASLIVHPSDSEDVKRQKRLARNRLSAAQHREKQRLYREALEAHIAGITKERNRARTLLSTAASSCKCGVLSDAAVARAMADLAPPMPANPMLRPPKTKRGSAKSPSAPSPTTGAKAAPPTAATATGGRRRTTGAAKPGRRAANRNPSPPQAHSRPSCSDSGPRCVSSAPTSGTPLSTPSLSTPSPAVSQCRVDASSLPDFAELGLLPGVAPPPPAVAAAAAEQAALPVADPLLDPLLDLASDPALLDTFLDEDDPLLTAAIPSGHEAVAAAAPRVLPTGGGGGAGAAATAGVVTGVPPPLPRDANSTASTGSRAGSNSGASDAGSAAALGDGDSNSNSSTGRASPRSFLMFAFVFVFGLVLGPWTAQLAPLAAVPASLQPTAGGVPSVLGASSWSSWLPALASPPAPSALNVGAVRAGARVLASVPEDALPQLPQPPAADSTVSKALSVVRHMPAPVSTPAPQSAVTHDPGAVGAVSSAVAMAMAQRPKAPLASPTAAATAVAGLRGAAAVSEGHLVAAGTQYGRAVARSMHHRRRLPTAAAAPSAFLLGGADGYPELHRALQTYANAALVSYTADLMGAGWTPDAANDTGNASTSAAGTANASYVLCPEAVGSLSEALRSPPVRPAAGRGGRHPHAVPSAHATPVASSPPPPHDDDATAANDTDAAIPLVSVSSHVLPGHSSSSPHPVLQPYLSLVAPASSLAGIDSVAAEWGGKHGFRRAPRNDNPNSDASWVEIGCNVVSVRHLHGVEVQSAV